MATTDVRQIAHQVSSSPTQTKARVEQLKQDSEIKKALEQTAGAKEPTPLTVNKKQKMFLGLNAAPDRVMFPKSNAR